MQLMQELDEIKDVNNINGRDQISTKTFSSNDEQHASSCKEVNPSDIDNDVTKPSSLPPVALKKNIDFISCLGILVGSIIGSGIFVSPQGVLIGTGSIGFSLVVWALCGFLTLAGTMVYAELGILIPYSGGNYIYLLEAFTPGRKEKTSWFSFIPFLHFWLTSLFIRPASSAVQGLATARYVLQLATFGNCNKLINDGNSALITKIIAAMFVRQCIAKSTNQNFMRFITPIDIDLFMNAFILAITGLNSHSNKLSTRIINMLTFIKLVSVTSIIVAGFYKLSTGTNEALYTGFEGTSFSKISTAYFCGIWAYSGWEFLNSVTRELVNPKRDLLRSLVTTCGIVTLVYLLVNISYYTVLSKEEFLSAEAVAVAFAESVAGKPGTIFIIASVAVSIFGASFGENFTGNRIVYAAAREGHMVELFSFIHFQRMTPTAAILFNCVLALLLIPNSSVLGLISMSGFIGSIFAVLTVISLLILRKQRVKCDEDFHVPFPFIIISFVTSGVFVIEPFVSNPQWEFLFVILLILIGAVFFVIFVYYKNRLPGISGMTTFVQKILLIVPPDDDEDENT